VCPTTARGYFLATHVRNDRITTLHRLLIVLVSLLAACQDASPEPRVVGTLERNRFELIAEAQEPIVDIPVREGQLVQKGDLLLQLDMARFVAQRAQAEAVRDRVKARLAELVRGPRAEKIAEARARLAGAESTLQQLSRDLQRAKELFELEVLAEVAFDRTQARYKEAVSRRDEAKVLLEELLEGTTVEELDQARAALTEAEAVLSEVNIRLNRLSVHAPVSGQIDALPYEVGERPPPGAVVVVMLADQAPYARVFVPEPIRAQVQPGTQAEVWVDGVAAPFAGQVRVISHQAAFTPYFALTERDRSRLMYVAEVDLRDAEAKTLPTGLPVEVVFADHSAHIAITAQQRLSHE